MKEIPLFASENSEVIFGYVPLDWFNDYVKKMYESKDFIGCFFNYKSQLIAKCQSGNFYVDLVE